MMTPASRVRTLDLAVSVRSSTTTHLARDRHAAYARLCAAVAACAACLAMRRVDALGRGNGPVPAEVMCVAEAPGRLGAAVTGVPLTRDVAGRRFEAFLALAGLDRPRLFVTNAVLCLPLDAQGRNRRPSPAEVRSCSRFLRASLAVVRPRVVLALGATALAALARVEPHDARLDRDAGRALPWGDRWLIPLYHPAFRSTVRRSQAAQEDDWRRAGQAIREILQCPHRPRGVVQADRPGYDPSKHPFEHHRGRAGCV